MGKKRQFGSIRKLPSGRWQARFRDPLTNRLVAAPSTFSTRGDASRWLAAVESGKFDQQVAANQRHDVRFETYARDWVATRKLRPRTRELYEGQLRLHILPILGDARLTRIEARHIRSWYATTSNGHLSEVSVAKAYRLLRSILATAVEDGFLVKNPCQVKHGGVERSAERVIPTVKEVKKLSAALPARYALVPWLAAAGGLRRGEIFGLARRHLDLQTGSVRVERAMQEINGRGVAFVQPKTIHGVRTVALPPPLLEMIAAHLATYVDSWPDALVFTNTHGRPVRSVVWRDAWAQARLAAGVKASVSTTYGISLAR